MENELIGQIPLADMIEALRYEISEAVSRSKGQTIRFGVQKIDLELSLQVSRSGSGKAGVKFWVVSAEATGTASATNVHKVSISLQPVDEKGRAILVSDRSMEEPK